MSDTTYDVGAVFRVSALSAERWRDRGRHLTPMHSHSYWHLNAMARGRIRIHLKRRGWIDLDARKTMLFPPGCKHEFEHPDAPYDMISVRFTLGTHVDFDDAFILPLTPFSQALRKAFLAVVSKPEMLSVVPGSASARILEDLVSALMRYLADAVPSRRDSRRAELLQTARRHIELSVDRGLTRQVVASMTGCSVSLLAKLFRETERVTLKTYVDRVRAQRAQDFLRGSDLPIYRIATDLGFPDPFTFSKFFRRVVGVAPRQFRKDARAAAQNALGPD